MPVIAHDCPLCSATNIAFEMVDASEPPDSDTAQDTRYVSLQCPRCRRFCGCEIKRYLPEAVQDPMQARGDPLMSGWLLVGFWPSCEE